MNVSTCRKEYQSDYSIDRVEHTEMKDAFEETPEETTASTAQKIAMPDVPELPEEDKFF